MKIVGLKIYVFKREKSWSIEYGQSTLWETPFSGMARILTDEGVEGVFISSASSLEELARRFKANRNELVGVDPLDRERIESALVEHRWSNSILSIIDACLWDVAGKFFKRPVYKLIGAYRDKILAYASGVEWAIGATQKDHVEMAVRCQKKGYRAFKIHPPYSWDWKKDIALCKAVRNAVGDDMILMFDPYSHPLYDREAAIRVGREIEKLGFYWYEDPIPTTDIEGLADLCRSLDIKMMIGEYIDSVSGYTELIRNHATDSLRCISGLVGGITPMLKIAHLAEAFGMKSEPHSYGNTFEQAAHLHVMLATRNCDFFELPIPEGTLDGCMKDTIAIDRDGYVHGPTKPGLGYDVDWSKVDRITEKVIELK